MLKRLRIVCIPFRDVVIWKEVQNAGREPSMCSKLIFLPKDLLLTYFLNPKYLSIPIYTEAFFSLVTLCAYEGNKTYVVEISYWVLYQNSVLLHCITMFGSQNIKISAFLLYKGWLFVRSVKYQTVRSKSFIWIYYVETLTPNNFSEEIWEFSTVPHPLGLKRSTSVCWISTKKVENSKL